MKVRFRSFSRISWFLALILGSLFLSFSAYATTSLDDAAIVAIYNQVNGFDIETGRLGKEKGHAEEVRTLAEMVTKDHTEVRKMATALSLRLSLSPTLPDGRREAAWEHQTVINDLLYRTGSDFDKSYLLHEIGFHANAIKAVKEVLLPSTKDPELRKLLLDVLPGFEHHLSETKKAAKKLGYY